MWIADPGLASCGLNADCFDGLVELRQFSSHDAKTPKHFRRFREFLIIFGQMLSHKNLTLKKIEKIIF